MRCSIRSVADSIAIGVTIGAIGLRLLVWCWTHLCCVCCVYSAIGGARCGDGGEESVVVVGEIEQRKPMPVVFCRQRKVWGVSW